MFSEVLFFIWPSTIRWAPRVVRAHCLEMAKHRSQYLTWDVTENACGSCVDLGLAVVLQGASTCDVDHIGSLCIAFRERQLH